MTAGASKTIRRRLMGLMLLTSAAGILLTCVAFVAYEFIAFRRQALQEVTTLGRIVSINSTAALAFSDRKDAQEVLGALKSEPSIMTAALYDSSGALFATYASSGAPAPPMRAGTETYRFKGEYLDGFSAVHEGPNRRLGTLYVRADVRAMYQRLWLYGLIAGAVMSASLLLAYVLSRILQDRISGPVLALADTARAVSERGDFSVRAAPLGPTEFIVLSNAFNHMLARIETQNAALKENEDRLRAVLDSALSAVVVMDAQGMITDWNARAQDIFGWPRDEAMGRLLAELMIPERDRDRHRKGLENFLRTGSGPMVNRTIETSALRRDGTEFPAEISVSILSQHSRPLFCGFITDMTERKQSAYRLQTQLARLDLLNRTTRAIGERQDLQSIFKVILRSLEDNLPIAFGCVYLCDADGQSLHAAAIGDRSAQFAAQLGVTTASTLSIAENGFTACVNGTLLYEPDIAEVALPFARNLASVDLRSLVVAPLALESKVFGLLITCRTERQGFSSADCEFLRQLSEHVALATHQTQLHTALQRAYDDLRLSQQTLLQQERLRALGQMASGVAHDINNAISPVALYTELLLEREITLSDQGREQLRIIQRAIADVAQTVARMREFYRHRDMQADLTSVDLNTMIEQALTLTRARWSDMPQERGIVIRVVTDLTADLPRTLGTESDIRDALTNLIFNAVDAMPEGGTLAFRTRRIDVAATTVQADTPTIELEVSDTGMGMDEETRRRCLEPFFTTKGERGTGMGLAMVYGMIERHRAHLAIDSAPGKGTTIHLRFATAPTATLAQTFEPEQAAQRRLRLLVIDDDPLLTEAVFHILKSDGHEVSVAEGGEAGIDAFATAHERRHPFDLVITDLGMPHVDGRAVAAAVKSISPHTPVLLLTGWGQRLNMEQSAPEGVDLVIGKPPKIQELRAALSALMHPDLRTQRAVQSVSAERRT